MIQMFVSVKILTVMQASVEIKMMPTMMRNATGRPLMEISFSSIVAIFFLIFVVNGDTIKGNKLSLAILRPIRRKRFSLSEIFMSVDRITYYKSGYAEMFTRTMNLQRVANL